MRSPGQTREESPHVALHKATSAVAHNWEQHKETIRNLYIERNYTLQQLIQEMRTLHGFDAT